MSNIHKVAAGECLLSIGFETGFFPQTLWELPENASLRKKRESPYILCEGDEVHIPDLRPRQESAAVNYRHRYKRKGVPGMLRIRFLDERLKPRPGLTYELNIGGQVLKGETDKGGWLKQWIPPDAMDAALIVTDNTVEVPIKEEYELQLGRLNPAQDEAGVRARLEHLGINCGKTEDDLSRAISSFQNRHNLAVTGKADDATIARLKELHLS